MIEGILRFQLKQDLFKQSKEVKQGLAKMKEYAHLLKAEKKKEYVWLGGGEEYVAEEVNNETPLVLLYQDDNIVTLGSEETGTRFNFPMKDKQIISYGNIRVLL